MLLDMVNQSIDPPVLAMLRALQRRLEDVAYMTANQPAPAILDHLAPVFALVHSTERIPVPVPVHIDRQVPVFVDR